MTPKQWSDIQRQLGYIEGMAMGVNGDLGASLCEGIMVLSEMLDKIAPFSDGKERE